MSIRDNYVIRWICLVPAVVLGIIVPGMIVRILFEDIFPLMNVTSIFRIKGAPMLLQAVVDGIAPIYIASSIAPRGKKAVSLITGFLLVATFFGVTMTSFGVNYWRDVPASTVLWHVFLGALTAVTAGIATWYFAFSNRGQ